MDKTLEELAEVLKARFEQGTHIEEELLLRFSRTLSDEVAEGNSLAFGPETESLKRYVIAQWTYPALKKEFSSEHAFALGAVYYMFKLAEDVSDKSKRQEFYEEQIECVKNYRDAFNYIRKSGSNGVTESRLAQYLNISKSECKKWIYYVQNKMRLLSVVKFGKTKVFYTSYTAEKILEELD